MGKIKSISSKIASCIADTFYRIGYTIACHPWKSISFTFFVFGLCSLGFLKFSIQKDPLELWVPKDSPFLQTTKWILKNLNTASRIQTVLVTAPNVLEPTVLAKLLKIHHEIEETSGQLNNGSTVKWSDVCLKIPFISHVSSDIGREKRNDQAESKEEIMFDFFGIGSLISKMQTDFEPSVDLPSLLYCKVLNSLPLGCYEKNFLELFKYPEQLSDNVTLDQVQRLIKRNESVSPVTGHTTDFSEMLGGIETNESGQIVGAKAIIIQWFIDLNLKDVKDQDMGNMAGTESWITEKSAAWEDAFLQKMKQLKLDLDDNDTQIHYSAEKSFGDISHEALFQDSDKIVIGIILMIVYVQIVLSKFSWTEIRFGLSGMGLLSVGFAFLSACGICSALGIKYGPVHTSLPFLLMGLGVDDVFVLMACWRKVQHEDKSIEQRIGLMVKHAGASITVTSLTDIIAFLVGSSTVIPSLQSFCLYAAIGVFMTYFYALTFFVAVFTLDEYRIKANRNSFVPFIVHKDEQLKYFCDFNLMHKFLNLFYGRFILTKFGKIIILMTVIALTSISGRSLLKIEQKFDPSWFIPETTYLHDYLKHSKLYFPESGYAGSVFMGKLNYSDMLFNIHNLTSEIEESNEMFYKTKSWIKPFRTFVKKNYKMDIIEEPVTDADFRFYLSKFLFSAKGGKYQQNFNFVQPLKCGEPTPNISVSWIDFTFKKFSHRDDYLPAMKKIEALVKYEKFNMSGDGFAQPWSKAYGNWITDEIIDREVYRNIILALICVMFCTMVIIVDMQVCFWIFVCVLLTLVNVGGFMQIWGLTIDLVSCIGLQLAVGLCVDYAAHIGHTFLVHSEGDRNKRVLDTILHIGAAVFYGGGSTLLALIFLSQSEAYTFKSFFKIFCLIIVFGLFHGVVLLPVILSLIGSKPYQKIIDPTTLENEEQELKPMNPMNGDVKKSTSVDDEDKTAETLLKYEKENCTSNEMNGKTQK